MLTQTDRSPRLGPLFLRQARFVLIVVQRSQSEEFWPISGPKARFARV